MKLAMRDLDRANDRKNWTVFETTGTIRSRRKTQIEIIKNQVLSSLCAEPAVPQGDRFAGPYGPEGQGFESLTACQSTELHRKVGLCVFISSVDSNPWPKTRSVFWAKRIKLRSRPRSGKLRRGSNPLRRANVHKSCQIRLWYTWKRGLCFLKWWIYPLYRGYTKHIFWY